MDSKQQKETLKYFKEFSHDWKRKANLHGVDQVNIIKQRNDFVISVINEIEKSELVLDAGCGTGDLVCKLAERGIKAIGVDFAQEMIDIAEENAKNSHLKNASFVCSSIFDFDFESSKYDVISGNGFIEYIAYEELYKFMEHAYEALKLGGSLVLGSRNRLFNIVAFNKFTEEEITQGNINLLLAEAVKLSEINNIEELIGFKTVPLQEFDKTHEKTGIEVTTRYQFTPGQLVNMLHGYGFEPIEIYPIHVHGVIPRFKSEYPDVHGIISNLLQNYARGNMNLIPQASSFMIHVKKR